MAASVEAAVVEAIVAGLKLASNFFLSPLTNISSKV
jgi:hypothetical protein